MNRLFKTIAYTLGSFFVVTTNVNCANASNISSCTYNGIPLYGKVKVVNSFPDIKVKVVSSFEDLDVQKVSSFADKCGKWQFVDSFQTLRFSLWILFLISPLSLYKAFLVRNS